MSQPYDQPGVDNSADPWPRNERRNPPEEDSLYKGPERRIRKRPQTRMMP